MQVKTAIRIVFIIVASSCGNNSSDRLTTTEPVMVQDTLPASATAPLYQILWESNTIRYDNAVTILIVTDSNSHQNMHALVDHFAHKTGRKKFTLVVFDELRAGLTYKASHYGSNEVNRIATKAELKLMDQHIVGIYTGELEANGEQYEIMYHGFGFEDESSEVYEPSM